jgi:cytochrome c-type biogenesis protein
MLMMTEGLVHYMTHAGETLQAYVQGHPFGWYSPLLALGLGLLNTLNPCTIAVLPIWAAWIFGDASSVTRPDGRSRGRLSLLFALGMVLMLTLLAFIALQLRWVVYGQWNAPWLYISLGLLTLILGIVPWLPWKPTNSAGVQRLLQPALKRAERSPVWKTLQPVVLGSLYAMVLSPCGTPYLIAFLMLLAQAPHPSLRLACILAYSLGQVFLFLMLPVIMVPMRQLLSTGWLVRIHHLANIVLVLAGLYLLWQGIQGL